MTLRLRIFLVVVSVVVLATVFVASFVYRTVSQELYQENADSLYAAATELQQSARATLERTDLPGATSGNVAPSAVAAVFPERFSPQFTKVLVQVLDKRGTTVLFPPGRELPVTEYDEQLAVSSSDTMSPLTEVSVRGEQYLMLTAAIPGGGAVQLARSLSERERVLEVIRASTLTVVLSAIFAAVIISWLLGSGVVRRISRLTNAAEQVASTGEFNAEFPSVRNDEAGRLSAAIQRMLSALEASREQQRRLVQDVGHELRTPLTSLRTNVEVLYHLDALPPEDLQSLLRDVQDASSSLTALVEEVVAIASGRYTADEPEDVVLLDSAAFVADTVSRRHGRTITVEGDDSVVRVSAVGLERAISNLLENAVKYDPSGASIEVQCSGGELLVLDRGPGVPTEDSDRVFDRFYRVPAQSSVPGSGLGLSIVADVVRSARGSVFVRPRPGGGSIFGFRLPTEKSRAEG